MCFPFDAQPPEAPAPQTPREKVDTEDLTLTSLDGAKDGTKFAGCAARAAQPSGAGIVVLPDVRGLFSFYEELARGFAAQGINAVAIDYFGRTAGVGKRDESFPFMEHVRQTKQPAIAGDVGAAVAYLRSPAGGSCSDVFTVGFCFGGSTSWLQAAAGHGLAGVIGFYGRPGPSFVDQSPGPIDLARNFTCPVLALMGGADQGIPQEQVDQFEKALKEAGVEHEIVVYPGAPHSFFDRSYVEHAAASSDAWRRLLDFIHAHQRAGAAAG